jgi:hypothetical protein
MMARRLACLALFLGGTASIVACSGESGNVASDESDLTLRAYEYTCTSPGARILDQASTIKLKITNGVLRFVDGFGENTGERDNTYRSPRNTSRVRYDGFEYGGDCELKLVIDDGAIRGAASATLRVQCSGDDFMQDIYACKDPRRARLEIPDPNAPPPVVPGPPASTKKWVCTSADGRILEKDVELQTTADDMRLVSDDLEYLGVRNRDYRARSGSYIAFEGFEYGGDCAMSAVVEDKILTAGTTEATLKVRCAGDDFHQDVYSCRTR